MSDIIAEYDAMLCMQPPMRRAGKKDLPTKATGDAASQPEDTSTPNRVEQANEAASNQVNVTDAATTTAPTKTETQPANGDS